MNRIDTVLFISAVVVGFLVNGAKPRAQLRTESLAADHEASQQTGALRPAPPCGEHETAGTSRSERQAVSIALREQVFSAQVDRLRLELELPEARVVSCSESNCAAGWLLASDQDPLVSAALLAQERGDLPENLGVHLVEGAGATVLVIFDGQPDEAGWRDVRYASQVVSDLMTAEDSGAPTPAD